MCVYVRVRVRARMSSQTKENLQGTHLHSMCSESLSKQLYEGDELEALSFSGDHIKCALNGTHANPSAIQTCLGFVIQSAYPSNTPRTALMPT